MLVGEHGNALQHGVKRSPNPFQVSRAIWNEMSEESRRSLRPFLLARVGDTLRVRNWKPTEIDASGLTCVATLSIVIHWRVYLLLIVELPYRPHYGAGVFASYVLLVSLLAAFTISLTSFGLNMARDAQRLSRRLTVDWRGPMDGARLLTAQCL